MPRLGSGEGQKMATNSKTKEVTRVIQKTTEQNAESEHIHKAKTFTKDVEIRESSHLTDSVDDEAPD